jgi:hypothetical protein
VSVIDPKKFKVNHHNLTGEGSSDSDIMQHISSITTTGGAPKLLLDVMGWLSIYGWKMLDSQWVMRQDWRDVSPTVLTWLRVYMGNLVFNDLVCASLAALRRDPEERQVIGMFHKPDEFLLDTLVTDGTRESLKIETILNGLFKAWIEGGLLEKV